MKSLLRRILGKSLDLEKDKPETKADQATHQRNVELETLEPRMLFSAAPVEPAADEAEVPDPEAAAAETQAADESVIEESPTTTNNSTTQIAAPVPLGTTVVSQAAAQQAATTLEGSELEGEDELGTVGAEYSMEQAAADTAAALSEISEQQDVTFVDISDQSEELNQQTLDAIAEAAADRWQATGLSAAQENALANATYQIADLDGGNLGTVLGSTITVDIDAGGRGWFVDGTPGENSEFGHQLTSNYLETENGAWIGYDLLSVMMHEQGHLLGVDHAAAGTAGNVMTDYFSPNQRILPVAEQAAGATPGPVTGTTFATFNVTTTADAGAGSLRQAILDANAAAGADDIVFNAGLAGSTISLTTQITITDDVHINNTGVANITVNQTGTNQRVFEVQGGTGTSAEATIFDTLTITGGNRTNSVGGGVYINGWADVTFDNVILDNNSATEGGGFYVAGALGAKVTLTDSDITNNTAITRGGGFRNSGFDTVVTMSDGKIDNNTVNNEHGGGFYNNGKVILTNVDITNNEVLDLDNTNGRFDDSYGGGFFNNASGLHPNAGQVSITGGSITDNVAFGHAGGFWNRGGTVTIDGTSGDPVEILRNQAGAAGTNGDTDGKGGDNRSGGGFWATDAATTQLNWVNFGNGTDTTDSNTVTSINQSNANNDLRGVGAGFFNSSQSKTWLNNVDLSWQRADQGAAFYQDGIQSEIHGTKVTIDDGFARTRGGGFRNATTGGLVDLTDSTIDGNTAQEEHGGGVYNNGTLNLDNTDVSNNIALDLTTTNRRDSHGGGIYNGGGTLTMTNGSDIRDNTTYGMGGGLWNTGGEFNMTDGVIDGNNIIMFSTSTRHGGGFWNQADSVANLHNVTISNNETGKDTPTGPTVPNGDISAGTRYRGVGGGFWNTDGSIVNITGDSQLIGNKSEDGGAFYNTSTASTVNITGTALNPIEIGTMSDPNSTRVRGGGFRSTGNTIVNLEHVDIGYNTTDDERGGGFYADGAQVTGNNVKIHDNATGIVTDNGNEQGGGFWVNSSGKLILTDSEITDNRSESNGGGFYVENGNVELIDTIVENNFSENSGGGFFVDNSGNVELTDVSVTDNIARDHGGGFWSEDDSKVDILRTNIDDNLAGYEDDGTTRVTGRYGGGFWSRGRSQITLTDSTVDRNEASVSAGGIFLDDDAHLIANGSSISENLASGEHGGGFRLDDRSTADITNSTISGNYAGFSAADNGGTPVLKVNDRVGGGIWTVHSTAVANLNHVTVTDNKASSGGGAGLYRSSGQINVENSIVYGNIGDFDNTMNASDTAGNSSVSVNLIEANVIGTNTGGTLQGNTGGLITTDPVLGPLMDNGGPTLPDGNSPRSHTIGSGGSADEAATNSSVAVDQLGNGRSSDIGAYELDPVASTLTIDDLIVPENAISGTAFDVEVVSTVVGGTVASVAWSVDAPVGGNLDTGTGETASLTATNPATDPVQTVDVTVTVTSTTGQTASETTQVRLVDILAMPMTGATPAHSAIVTIATDEDDGDVSLGDISLREAIKLANASAAGTFVITFDSALNGTDIEMSIAPTSSSDNENGNVRGDFDITKSNGAVSIVGNGAANTTINAMQVDRVFDLHEGRIAYFTDLTITGGETTTSDRQGGALYSRGGTAIFKDVDIDDNHAAQASNAAVGGAMYLRASGSQHSATYITGGSVANNTAESNGGGIYFEGTNVGESILYMENTTLSNNIASVADINVDSRRGGGIYMTDDGNRLVMNNVAIEDNKTFGRNASDGGGLAIAGADHTIEITGGHFHRNQAGDNPGGTGTNDSDGGGMWSGAFRSEFNFTGVDIGGELTNGAEAAGIGSTRMDGNIAEDEGGGFYLEGRFNTYNLVDTRIIGNQANDDGGGFMVINDTETVNISQTGADLGVIRNNFSQTSNGGGFRSDGILNITGTASIPFEIRYNEARGSVGGGFYTNQNSTATLTDVVIHNNEARNNGGGFYNAGGSHVILTSSTPSTSGTPGSFVSKIYDNEARFGDGGGFYTTTANSNTELTDVLIDGNISADDGAGFYLSSNFAEVNLTDVDLTNNLSEDSGAGFNNASNGSIVNLDNVLIDSNIARTEHGGGFRSSGHVNGQNVTITNNQAGTDLAGDRVGGGFYNPAGRVDLTDVTIDDNWAHARGGGFFASSGGVTEIDSSDPNTFRSSISNNTVIAASNDGGGFFMESVALTKLTSVDVNNNTAGDEGGGFFIQSDSTRVDLVDVTIDDNTAGNEAGGIRNASAWSIVTLDNTRITNNQSTNHHAGGAWNRGSFVGQDVIFDGNVASTAQATADSNDNNVGGGFWNNGDGAYANLTRVEITNNESHGRGGGVYNDSRAELVLTDFIISGNSTDQNTSESQGRGGGIWNSSGADVFLNRGEISANTSFGHGGGVYSQESGSTISATNVTFSGNQAGIDPGEGFEGSMVGGGLWAQSNGGTVYLDHTTFTENQATRPNADAGAGFRVDSNGLNVTMKDSVAYGNFRNAAGTLVDDDLDQNLTGTNFILEGNNIVGFRSGNAPAGGDVGGYVEGISTANDPGFLPLLDLGGAILPSGGAARVHAIGIGASASDTAVTSTLTEDERGIVRPEGSFADIGAYEGPGTIYVNDQFAGALGDTIADGDLETVAAEGAFFGVSAFDSIASALSTYTSFAGNIIVNGGTYATANLTGGTLGDINLQLVQDLSNGENEVTITTLTGDATDSIETQFHGAANAGLIVGDGDFDGAISGDGDLTKNTAGTLTLGGANTYTGTTSVDAGTLLQDGSHTGGGGYSVASGGTLGGSGSTDSAVSAASGGTLTAGNGVPGTLDVADTTLVASSTFSVQLDGIAPGDGAGNHDQLVVTGTVDLGGSTLSAAAGVAPTAANTYVIIDNDGADAVTGTFAGLAEGATVTVSGTPMIISYVGGDGNDVVLFGGTAETEVSIDGSGNLVITDINGGASADDLTVSHDGTWYTITDPNLVLTTSGIASGDVMRPDAMTVRVRGTAVTAGMTLDLLGGTDSTDFTGAVPLNGNLSLDSAEDVNIVSGANVDLNGNAIDFVDGTNNLNIEGGTVSDLGSITESGGALSTSTINLNSDTLGADNTNITVDYFNINPASTPPGGNVTYTRTGGTLTVNNDLTLGGEPDAEGPENGRGNLTQNGGAVTVGGDLLFGGAPNTEGGTYDLNGGTLNVTGDVIEGASGAPTSSVDTAQLYVDQPGVLTVGGDITVQSFRTGDNQTGSHTVTSGQTVTTTGTLLVGRARVGTLTLESTGNVAANMTVSDLANSAGSVLTIADGADLEVNGQTDVGDNDNSSGTINVDGLLNQDGNLYIGGVNNPADDLANGAVNVSATGQVDVNGGNTEVGRVGTGTLTIDGGTFNQNTNNLVVGQNATSDGTVTVNSGAVNVTNDLNFNAGTGTFTQNDGTVTIGDDINLANGANTSTYNLAGGTLDLTGDDVNDRGGPAVFNFTDGTLVDVNQFGIDLTQQGGLLLIGPDGNVIDTMTVNGNYNQTAGTLETDLGAATSDTLVVNGTVTLAGDLDLGFAASFVSPASAGTTYTLIDNDGTDAVVGTFTGLAEGSIISLNNGGFPTELFQITYAGGTGNNDVVLTALGVQPTTDVLVDGSGNLVINDIDEAVPAVANGNSTDTLTIRVEGSEVVVSDPNNALGTLIAGAVQTSVGEVRVGTGLFTGDVIVNGLSGDDLITIGDLGSGTGTGLPGGIQVHGGDGFDNILYTGKGSVLPSGGNAEFNGEEIDFWLGSELTTENANITLNGTGGIAEGGGTFQGVHLFDSDLTINGTGAVTLNGSGGDTGANNAGVLLTTGSTVTTNDGNIDVDGSGGGTVSGRGVAMLGADLSAGGSGTLSIDGTGGGSSLLNEGVHMNSGTSLTVDEGDLSINGTGGGSLGLGRGVTLTLSDLTSTGDGNISVTGSSAATGGGNNVGVQLWGTDVDTTAGSGSVTISGSGAATGTVNNMGVRLSDVDIDTAADANIDIDGNGGGSGSGGIGVQLTGDVNLTVTGTGGIDIDGTGATGSGIAALNNDGVEIGTAADLNFENGDLTIDGTGGGSGATVGGSSQGVNANGVTMTGSGSGSVLITGTATGNGSANQGVALSNSTITTAAGSGGAVTLDGTGSAAGLSNNDGVKLANTDVMTGTGGTIDIDGIGGGTGTGTGNNGVTLVTGSTLSTGNAAVSIAGTAGSGTSLNRGVYIHGIGSSITSGSGNIDITGSGNGTGSLNRGIETGYLTANTSGTLTLTGTGSGSGMGVFNSGVYLLGTPATGLTAGTLNITGAGGTGSTFNEGVRLVGGAFNGALTLAGTANTGTLGVYNTGVYLLNVNFTGASGSISGTGGGGTGFNHGIYRVPPTGLTETGTAGTGATSLMVAPTP